MWPPDGTNCIDYKFELFKLKNLLKLCSQYSGSVVPLAMFFATLMMEIDKFDSHA